MSLRKPNIERYNPDPYYINDLIYESGMDIKETAKLLGISARSLWDRLNVDHPSQVTYPMQHLLEWWDK